MIDNEEKIIPEIKEKPKRTRSTVKEKPLEYHKIYLKGLTFNEIIKFDNSDNHSHRIDGEVYKSELEIKGELVTITIKWNVSRSNYQGLVTTIQGTTSLSFFPHFEHCQTAIKKFLERMI